MREEQIGHKCEDALPLIEGGSIDLVITSPPYNLGNTSGGGFPKLGHYNSGEGMAKRGGGGKWRAASAESGIANGYGEFSDNLPHDEYVAQQKSVLRECWRTLSEDGAIFYNHKPRIFGGRLVTPLEYIGDVPIRQIVIWARSGGINFSPAFYLPTHEWIVIIAKDAFRLKSKGASGAGDVWRINQEMNSDHPAPFPIEIPLTALETTGKKRILDPYSGSGTTACACVQSGCDFIGIERDERFFDASCRRIEREIASAKSRLPFDVPKTVSTASLFEDQ